MTKARSEIKIIVTGLPDLEAAEWLNIVMADVIKAAYGDGMGVLSVDADATEYEETKTT